MANLSQLTRREQVFEYLKIRLNAWVDGTELATASVGGSEGLKRLRELRQELKPEGRFEIQQRGHPDPDKDIWQYRMVERPTNGYAAPAPAETVARAVSNPVSRPSRRGHVVYDIETDSYVAVYDGPPVVDEDAPFVLPGQTDMGVPEVVGQKYTRKPTKLELGRSIMCPMCKGIHRAIKEPDPITGKARRDSRVIGYEETTRDPRKPSKPCPRCDGFGVIPA